MKLIIFVLMFLSITSLVSAEVISIVAGEESEPFTLDEPYSYYEITGNSTIIDVEILKDGNIITIIPDKYLKNDTFTITFYNEKEEEIPADDSPSGGGGSSYDDEEEEEEEVDFSITYNYKCEEWGEWSDCKDKSQARYCSNIVLANESSELSQSRTCKVEDNITDIIDNDIVVDDVEPTNNKIIYIILGVLFFLLVIGIVIYVINRFRGEREPEENEIINPQQNQWDS